MKSYRNPVGIKVFSQVQALQKSIYCCQSKVFAHTEVLLYFYSRRRRINTRISYNFVFLIPDLRSVLPGACRSASHLILPDFVWSLSVLLNCLIIEVYIKYINDINN